MILDSISNIGQYKGLTFNLDTTINFMKKKNFDFKGLPKIEIDGNNIFALNINYITYDKESFDLEAHKKYIDIHYILEGQEIIMYESKDKHSIVKKYSREDDYLLFKPVLPNRLFLRKGMFCIFFKDDLHMPGFINERKMDVQKLVVKVIMEKI